ncbi:hypothetical protein [Nocardia xishanensis]
MTLDYTPGEATAAPDVEAAARRAKEERSAKIERGVTLFTAGIASVVAAQGMYVMFSESLHMHPALQALCFAFIELMVVASAMRARRSQIDTGSAGVDGVAMWVLTILSGVLAASHATGDVGLLVLRLAAPLVAAWGWERSMALERRQLTGRDGGMNWRWSPQRLLVKWGIADPTDRTVAEVAVERRLADLARAADAVRIARTTRSGRAERKAMQRLHRAIDKAADDGVVLGEDSVRDRLAEHLEGRFSAYTLPNYRPVTDWADHTDRAPRPTLETIEADPAVRAEIAELEREVGRELTERANTSRAIDDPSSIAARANETATDPVRADADRTQGEHTAVDRSRVRNLEPRARELEQRASEDLSSIAIDTAPTRDEAPADHAPIAQGDETYRRPSIAAHIPAELGTDRVSIVDRADRTATEETSDSEPQAETETDAARDRRAMVSLVRADRDRSSAHGNVDRSRGRRSPIARDGGVEGALARAVDRASITRDTGRGTIDRGPFPRELSRAEANNYARAVVDRGLSRQPIEVLARIYEARSQGRSKNHIGTIVGLPHSTVGRAITAVSKVTGPRAID